MTRFLLRRVLQAIPLLLLISVLLFALLHAARLRRHHERLRERRDHRPAQVARPAGRLHEREDRRRHHEMPHVIDQAAAAGQRPARRREPPERHGEDHLQQQAEPERR